MNVRCSSQSRMRFSDRLLNSQSKLADLIQDLTKFGVGDKAKSSISGHEGEPIVSIPRNPQRPRKFRCP
jgi:hypothetical protein